MPGDVLCSVFFKFFSGIFALLKKLYNHSKGSQIYNSLLPVFFTVISQQRNFIIAIIRCDLLQVRLNATLSFISVYHD